MKGNEETKKTKEYGRRNKLNVWKRGQQFCSPLIIEEIHQFKGESGLKSQWKK